MASTRPMPKYFFRHVAGNPDLEGQLAAKRAAEGSTGPAVAAAIADAERRRQDKKARGARRGR